MSKVAKESVNNNLTIIVNSVDEIEKFGPIQVYMYILIYVYAYICPYKYVYIYLYIFAKESVNNDLTIIVNSVDEIEKFGLIQVYTDIYIIHV
jgi:hypothetical protein